MDLGVSSGRRASLFFAWETLFLNWSSARSGSSVPLLQNKIVPSFSFKSQIRSPSQRKWCSRRENVGFLPENERKKQVVAFAGGCCGEGKRGLKKEDRLGNCKGARREGGKKRRVEGMEAKG